MDWDEYQRDAHTFAEYENEWYPFCAIVEEIGELAGKVARWARGDESFDTKGCQIELGDILWNFSECQLIEGNSLGLVFSEIDGVIDQIDKRGAIYIPGMLVVALVEIDIPQALMATMKVIAEEYLQTTLEECAKMNLEKLRDRKSRGVIKGKGDKR